MKIQTGHYYAVTINPSLKHYIEQYDGDLEVIRQDQYDSCSRSTQREYLSSLLVLLNNDGECLDINYERTPRGNLHVHFTYHYLSNTHTFEKTLRDRLSLSEREFKLKKIFDRTKWIQYVEKDSIPEKPMF